MSALSAHFSNHIFDNRNIIHPHVQADYPVLHKQYKICRDLETNIKVTKSSQLCVCKGNIFILFWWVDYSLVDIMVKIDTIWLTSVSLRSVVTLKI